MLLKIFGKEVIATGEHALETEERARSFDEIVAALDSQNVLGGGVSRTTSVRISTVFACTNIIAEAFANVPVRIYKVDDKGDGQLQVNHTIDQLFNRMPNDFMNAFEFREFLAWNAVLDRGGFAYINKPTSSAIELLPLLPNQVRPVMDKNWRFGYEVRLDGAAEVTLTRDKILHVRRVPLNGVDSLNIIDAAREVLGLARSAEQAQRGLHDGGGRIAGVLSTENKIGPEGLKAIKTAWDKAYAGGANSYKTAILDNGFKFSPMQLSAEESQMIESRRFSVEEICRMFNVFPQMVMQSANTSTYASAEAFFAAHVRHTLQPWWKRLTGAIDVSLLDGRGPIEPRVDTREYTRAATKDRGQYYRTLVEMGIYTRNEVREMEGLPRIEGLDEPLTPLNMNPGADPDTDPDTDPEDEGKTTDGL